MKEQSKKSHQIARWLNDHGLQGIAAFLLEVSRPFSVLAAQAAYMAEPLFGGRESMFRELASFLEDSEQIDELVDRLHKDPGE